MPIALRAAALALTAGAVVSIWYVLGYMQRGDDFIAKIRYENFERFTSSMQDEPHKHSVFYLFGMLFIGLIPWSLVWLYRHMPTLKPGSLPCLKPQAARRWYKALPDLYKFSVIATGSVVIFFCIPSSKRSVYLLPAFPFMVLLLERGLRDWMKGRPRFAVWTARMLLGLSALISVAAVVLMFMSIGGMRLDPQAFIRGLVPLKVLSIVGLVGGGVWIFRDTWRELLRDGWDRIGLAVIATVVVVSFFVYDTTAHQLSVREWVRSPEFVASVRPQERQKMYSFGAEAYGASFYLHIPFFRAAGPLERGAIVFLERRKLPEFEHVAQARLVEISHYASGLEKSGKDIIVVETSQ